MLTALRSTAFAFAVALALGAQAQPDLRLPPPPPSPGEASPGGTPLVTDPALASFANYTIYLRGTIPYYHADAHRYDPAYINPQGHSVFLDARLGLSLNYPHEVSMRRTGPDKPHPVDIDDFAEFVATPPSRFEGADRGPPFMPPELLAYRWTVEDARRPETYRATVLKMRGQGTIHYASFTLPKPGRYRVRLQVIFDGGRQGESVNEFEFREWFFVSLGDSSASGEGNPKRAGHPEPWSLACEVTTQNLAIANEPNMAAEPEWAEPEAHRSWTSGPALAAKALNRVFAQTWSPSGSEDSKRLDFDKVIFASFARSGAKTYTGLIASQKGAGDFIGAGQIEEARRTAAGRRIDVLMINIGGNDAGFSGVLKDLILENASVFRLYQVSDAGARREAREKIEKFLGVNLPPGQESDFDGTLNALRGQIETLRPSGLGDIYITGYPTGLFQYRRPDRTIGYRSCEIFRSRNFMNISTADAEAITQWGRLLNEAIKKKATEFGWRYIDVESDFEGRGYCAPGPDRYWVHAQESCRRQGDWTARCTPTGKGTRPGALGILRQSVVTPFHSARTGQSFPRPRTN